MDLNCVKARRRLLWQLTSRFDVGRGLFFDESRQRLCWDATTPIPSDEHGVRRWPAITLHSDETLEKVAAHPELAKYEWPPILNSGALINGFQTDNVIHKNRAYVILPSVHHHRLFRSSGAILSRR